jgi:predicted ArsR family transcriptional regulator
MPINKQDPDEIDRAIMIELKRYPPASLRQIGSLLGRSHITVRQRIEWLEENGYVQQAPNVPEGGSRGKILTEQGFRYLSKPYLKTNKFKEKDANGLHTQ